MTSAFTNKVYLRKIKFTIHKMFYIPKKRKVLRGIHSKLNQYSI